jgi:hypothetical protein
VLLPMPLYVLVQPVVRYRYPIGALLVFLAADGVWRAAAALLRQGSAEPVLRRSHSHGR